MRAFAASATDELAPIGATANVSAMIVDYRADGTARLVTRGWADVQNHASLTRGGNYQSMDPGAPLVPGFRFQSGTPMPTANATAPMLTASERRAP